MGKDSQIQIPFDLTCRQRTTVLGEKSTRQDGCSPPAYNLNLLEKLSQTIDTYYGYRWSVRDVGGVGG